MSILLFMKERAKIFQNGGSQAVRLPKSCRFDDGQHEVLVKRVGRRVILEAADEWTDDFVALFGAWTEPIDKPRTRSISKLRDPFE